MALQTYRSYSELAERQPFAQQDGYVLPNEPQVGHGLYGAHRGYEHILANRVILGNSVSEPLAGLEELFAKLLEYWDLSQEQGAALAGYPAQSVNKIARVLNGLRQFETVDERERVIQLFAIRRTLGGLYRSRDAENRWLRSPNAGLEGASPLTVLLSRSFPNMLKVRQFVDYLAQG